MPASHWLLLFSLVVASRCASIHELAKRASEPSLDLTLATGSSGSSTSSQHNAGKGKALLDLFPIEASKLTYQQADKAAPSLHNAEDNWMKDWLLLGHPGTSTSQQAPAPQRGRPRSNVTKGPRAERRLTWKEERQSQLAKQNRFWQEWAKLGLGTHMTPGDLAKGVRRIQYDDLQPQHAAQWIHQKLKSNRDYYMQYDVKQRGLTHRLSQIKKRMKNKDDNFKRLPPKVQDQLVLDRLTEVEAKRASLADNGPRTDRGLKDRTRRTGEAAKQAMVGQLFESHFAVRKIDPARLTPKDLEEATRGLYLEGIEDKRFNLLLNKYLGHRDGIDLISYKFLRREHNKSKDAERRREAKGIQPRKLKNKITR